MPSTFQSGDRDTHGRITKRASAELRTMLCEATHQARRPSHPLHPHFSRPCPRRGGERAVVTTAHRLCRILFVMLRDGAHLDPKRLGLEEGPYTHTTTCVCRLTPKPAGRLRAFA